MNLKPLEDKELEAKTINYQWESFGLPDMPGVKSKPEKVFCAWCGVDIEYIASPGRHIEYHTNIDEQLELIRGFLNL